MRSYSDGQEAESAIVNGNSTREGEVMLKRRVRGSVSHYPANSRR